MLNYVSTKSGEHHTGTIPQLTLDKQLPIGISAPSVTVPTTETALVPAEPIRIPNNEAEPTPANH